MCSCHRLPTRHPWGPRNGLGRVTPACCGTLGKLGLSGLFFSVIYYFSLGRVSLCSTGWPRTHCVAHAGLELAATLPPRPPAGWDHRRTPAFTPRLQRGPRLRFRKWPPGGASCAPATWLRMVGRGGGQARTDLCSPLLGHRFWAPGRTETPASPPSVHCLGHSQPGPRTQLPAPCPPRRSQEQAGWALWPGDCASHRVSSRERTGAGPWPSGSVPSASRTSAPCQDSTSSRKP